MPAFGVCRKMLLASGSKACGIDVVEMNQIFGYSLIKLGWELTEFSTTIFLLASLELHCGLPGAQATNISSLTASIASAQQSRSSLHYLSFDKYAPVGPNFQVIGPGFLAYFPFVILARVYENQ